MQHVCGQLAWSLLQVAREALVTKEALRDAALRDDSRHVWNDVRLTTSSTERASGVEKPSGTTTSPRRSA